MLCEVARISVAAEASMSSEARTPLSKSPASLLSNFFLSISVRRLISSCSTRSRSLSIMFCLNISTAFAMSPISSRRFVPGTAADVSPLASTFIAPVIWRTGREMPRVMI